MTNQVLKLTNYVCNVNKDNSKEENSNRSCKRCANRNNRNNVPVDNRYWPRLRGRGRRKRIEGQGTESLWRGDSKFRGKGGRKCTGRN